MQLNWPDDATPTLSNLSSSFPEKMVLLDCKTTVGKAIYHRIIEYGMVEQDFKELSEVGVQLLGAVVLGSVKDGKTA
jgi:DNA polymerase III epsilon subunit-like protein|tara:strand:- start:14121 stop:14351 length:231 start_codon:yes stop_codon:yes gene_type:complete